MGSSDPGTGELPKNIPGVQAPQRPGKGKRRNRDVSSFSGACCSSGEILKGSGEVREGINQGIFPGIVGGGRR